jgi:predicted nucleic acid-binding Zn ribbon protein
MPLEKDIECKNCGNSCTVHYEESPYDDAITYCPFCGNEFEDEYEEDEDEPF